MSETTTRLERASDRLNPVLVKEVRQALRGKAFRGTYLTVLLLAVLIGLSVVSSSSVLPIQDDSLGERFFVPLFGALCLGLCTLLPLACFQSMVAEWEGSTQDLLALTDLTPGRILRGKLLTALVQGLLFSSAFLPLIALATQLPGVDLLRVATLLTILPLASGTLCCFALSTAASTRAGGQRSFVLGALALLLVLASWGLFLFGWQGLGNISDRKAYLGTVLVFALFSLGGIYLYLTALGPLSHPEENASTPVRLFLTAATILVVVAVLVIRSTWIRTDMFLAAMSTMLIIASAIPGLGLVTERSSLGRRTAREVGRRRTPVLFAPWLPGGARGYALVFLLTGTVAVLPLLWAAAHGTSLDKNSELLVPMGLWLYLLLYLSIPVLFLSSWCTTLAGRWRARVLVVAIAMGGAILPALVGALIGENWLEDGLYLTNPLWVVWRLERGLSQGVSSSGLAASVLVGVTLAVLFLCALRAARGFAEVARARREYETDPR